MARNLKDEEARFNEIFRGALDGNTRGPADVKGWVHSLYQELAELHNFKTLAMDANLKHRDYEAVIRELQAEIAELRTKERPIIGA